MADPWILDLVYISQVLSRLATLGRHDPAGDASARANEELWKGVTRRLDITDLPLWFARLACRNLPAMKPRSGGNGAPAPEHETDVSRVKAQLAQYLSGAGASTSSKDDWTLVASDAAQRRLIELIPTLAGDDPWAKVFDQLQWAQVATHLRTKAAFGDVARFFEVSNREKMRTLLKRAPEEVFARLVRAEVRAALCQALHCEEKKLFTAWVDEVRQLTRREVAPDDILEAENTKRRILEVVRSLVPSMSESLESTLGVVSNEWTYHHDFVALHLALSGNYREAARRLMNAAPDLSARLSGEPGDPAQALLLMKVARLLEGLQFDVVSREKSVDMTRSAVVEQERRRPLLPIGRTSGSKQVIRDFVAQERARMLSEDPQASSV